MCQYDDADRLTSVNGQGYTWDDDGKLTGDASRAFQYDGAGRLTQVVSGTLTTQYAYNGDGDRVSMTVNGQPVAYTLDPSGLTDVLEARQGVSVTTYLYGLLGPLAEELPSGQRLYYGRDALGGVRFVMDENGEILNRYGYDPFGNQYYAETEDVTPAFRFAGEQWDASSGLYYLRARYYDPTSGRFVSRDPFPGLMYLPQTLNPYAYVTNNPVNLTDPSGEIPVLILAGLFIAGGFLGGAGAYTLYPYVYPDTCGHWDPAYALVWAGGGALLGAGMFGAGYGGWMLGVHFGWWTPAAGPLLGKSATDIYQRYANTTAAMLPQAQRTVSQGMTSIQTASAGPVRAGTNTIYLYVENEAVKYVGMTNNFARRATEHLRASHGQWRIEPISGLEELSRFDARAVEQVLIEYYELVNLYNQINSVSTRNPLYTEAIRRGREILDMIRYFE